MHASSLETLKEFMKMKHTKGPLLWKNKKYFCHQMMYRNTSRFNFREHICLALADLISLNVSVYLKWQSRELHSI